MAHILANVPYAEVKQKKVTLPERLFDPDYERQTLPDELYVPKVFLGVNILKFRGLLLSKAS